MTATDILAQAAAEMADRAVTYDQPDGERSMGKTVAMFNAAEGLSLTEAQGWRFMACLKYARATQGALRLDSYVDGAAYMALAGEAAEREAREVSRPALEAVFAEWCELPPRERPDFLEFAHRRRVVALDEDSGHEP